MATSTLTYIRFLCTIILLLYTRALIITTLSSTLLFVHKSSVYIYIIYILHVSRKTVLRGHPRPSTVIFGRTDRRRADGDTARDAHAHAGRALEPAARVPRSSGRR